MNFAELCGTSVEPQLGFGGRGHASLHWLRIWPLIRETYGRRVHVAVCDRATLYGLMVIRAISSEEYVHGVH